MTAVFAALVVMVVPLVPVVVGSGSALVRQIVSVTDGKFVGAGCQVVGAGPLEGILRFKELRVDFDGAVEVEAADVQHLLDRDVGVLRAVDLRHGVDGVQAFLESSEFGRGDEVGLVENDDVRETNLFHGLGRVVKVEEDMLGVDERDDGVEGELLLHLRVGEEGLGDGRRVGEAGGLDEDGVEAVLAFHQPAEDAEEVAAHGAADAAVVHLEDFLVTLDDELVVHAHLAELVLDDGDLPAVLFGQDAVEQGGLAGAEEAGEDSDGNGSERHRNEQGAVSRPAKPSIQALQPALGGRNSSAGR